MINLQEISQNVFLKEREQYFEIQDLKAQLQDKGIAISELKKLIEMMKGKSVETKFEVIRQPNAFKSQRQSILGKPSIFLDSLAKKDFSKSKPVTTQNVSNDFSKPVTTQILPYNMLPIVKNTNVIAPGMYKVHPKPNQTRTPQLHQDIRKTNKCVSFSTGVIPTISVRRLQLKSNQLEDRVMSNNSQGKKKKVEDHCRNFKFSNNKTSVTACNDNLNAKTLNVNFVYVTCGKCVLNENHHLCVLHYINGVNSRTRQPMAVPITRRDHSIYRRLWVLKAHDQKSQTLLILWEKGNFWETVKLEMIKLHQFLGYGDCLRNIITHYSGGNLGGHSSSDKSLSGNEGEMTLQSVYDLCLSLCAQVSDQAKEIQYLKAQIKKLKKQAKPVIKHHRAWIQSVSLKQRLARKRSSKKQWVHKESVSKQGKKFAKGEPSVQRDPLFDEIPEDTLDHMETENAQDVGRTRDIVGEEKENDEIILSTEDVLSTDKEKVSTDRPIVSTDGSKVSTDKQIEGTDEQIESTDEQRKGTEDHTEEGSATQATQTPTSTIFGDDETIAKVLLNMSQAKAVSREKEKGVELKDIEETDRPRPTSTRSLLTLKPLPKIDPKDKGKKKIEEEDESESESDGIPEAEKKFKQLASDEEMARKIQEEWEGEEERNRLAEEKATNEALIRNYDDIKARIEADRLLAEKLQEEEREQFTIEERAKFLHDTIAAQRKFLAQQRSEAIRNRPPTKNQLRNQMMTYLKHVGNFKHSELKTKKFEEIQALYKKIKRSDEDFISIGSGEDKRLIKKRNEKGIDSSKKEEVKEESKEEESNIKRKLGTWKKMKSRKRRFIQNTSEDDSEKENDELRLYLTIAPDEEKEVDYEILDKKYPIKEWKTECLGTKPQVDKAEHLEEINQNVVIRRNRQKRYFSTLMRVLSIFDRDDLNAVYQLVMDKYQDEIPEGFDRLHGSSGVHTLMTEAGLVIHMLIEKKYPLRKKVLLQMLDLKLESEEDSTMALELIRFVKKQVAELEPEDSNGDEEDL
ncbi:hypothetical protein Tco_0164621 [Tanacetum coccineum]